MYTHANNQALYQFTSSLVQHLLQFCSDPRWDATFRFETFGHASLADALLNHL